MMGSFGRGRKESKQHMCESSSWIYHNAASGSAPPSRCHKTINNGELRQHCRTQQIPFPMYKHAVPFFYLTSYSSQPLTPSPPADNTSPYPHHADCD
jgi:hypothetical protein